jgi:broad specificity phosphatase PhoE
LASERVAAVYTSTLQRAVGTGDEVAGVLGVGARAVEGLAEFSVGRFAGEPGGADGVTQVFARWLDGDLSASCPGAESGADVVARYRAALAGIADQHRGETVVVVSHGGVMSLCLPHLCGNVSDDLARARWIPNCGMARVLVDADDWALHDWPGVETAPQHDGPPPVAEAPAAVPASD